MVSVVLPTYDRSSTLERAIQSVLSQTYDDLELIIVDDASTDATNEVIDQIEDDRVRAITHDENRGAAAARNTGLELAAGDFVAFQDSDDEWDRSKLEKQMDAYSWFSDDVGVVYSQLHRHLLDGSVRCLPRTPVNGDIHERLLRNNFVSIQTAVVRKRCFDNVGTFDERFPRLIDWEFWLRVSKTVEFYAIEEPLVNSFVQPDSISIDDEALVEARELLIETHREAMNPAVEAMHLFRTGHAALKADDGVTGRQYLKKAIRVQPRVVYIATFAIAHFGPVAYRHLYQLAKWTYQSIHG